MKIYNKLFFLSIFQISFFLSFSCMGFGQESKKNTSRTLENFSYYDSVAMLYQNDKNFDQSIEFSLQSLTYADSLNDNQYKKKALRNLFENYFYLDEYENSLKYLNVLLKIQQNEKDFKGTAETLITIGVNYFHWSKYDSAKILFEKALDLASRYKLEKQKANALRYLGSVYSTWGEYKTALDYIQQSLVYWESVEDEIELAKAYNSLGIFYQEVNEFEKSLDYYEKSLEIFNKRDDSLQMANLNLHIGDIYLFYKNYPKALGFYFKAEDMLNNLNNKKLTSIALSNIGEAYFAMKKYYLALDYQERSLEIKKNINDKKRLAISYYSIGNIYFELKQYQSALENLLLSLNIAHEVKINSQIQKCYKSLSAVYEEMEEYALALEYYKKHVKLRDQLFSDERNRTILEMRTRYESEKKEKTNEKLRNTELLNQVKIRKQWYLIGVFFIILIFIMILLYLNYSKQKFNKRKNGELLEKNRLIENQKLNSQKLNRELMEANASKDKFFSIVAHDLKDPFASLIGFSNLLDESYDEFNDDEKKNFIKQIKTTSENTYSLLNNILDWAKTQSNNVPFNPEHLNVKTYIEKTINLIKPAADKKDITLNLNTNEIFSVFADKNMFLTILLNLISNSIKFTNQHGQVNIYVHSTNKAIEISIEDNGVGMDTDTINKLFKIEEKIISKGTAGENGTGLGLILCNEFIEKHQGEINVESIVGKGSKFSISFPII